jgi:hypothetical protein
LTGQWLKKKLKFLKPQPGKLRMCWSGLVLPKEHMVKGMIEPHDWLTNARQE